MAVCWHKFQAQRISELTGYLMQDFGHILRQTTPWTYMSGVAI
jgi:hypothetical protein